jgi:2-polyprenyl-3-methyl-5-hydroxy-6-metoxy-1,4-benzoquinol methylase
VPHALTAYVLSQATGYQVKFETVSGCGADLQIRSLLDRQQYDDPQLEAELAGIPAAAWSLFGVVWPSARGLAQHMLTFELGGQRILEVGCGLALSSLVLHRRDGDVTASDCHPLVPSFLTHNLRLNGLATLPYQASNWARPAPRLGRFDVVIGSDVLYEPGQAEPLAHFMDEHVEADGQVLLTDPNRGHRARFSREMEDHGFGVATQLLRGGPGIDAAYRGRLMTYSRGPK